MEGEQINILDGDVMALSVRSILARPALGLTNPDPIGGFIAGAGKTIPLYEGLQQINGVAVLALPVRVHPPQDQP